MAQSASLSESGFRKLFKKAYGVTPKQYQQSCRMTEAKWLLRSSGKSIQGIAELIGFKNMHSFSTWFQQQEGKPPSEWRKMQGPEYR